MVLKTLQESTSSLVWNPRSSSQQQPDKPVLYKILSSSIRRSIRENIRLSLPSEKFVGRWHTKTISLGGLHGNGKTGIRVSLYSAAACSSKSVKISVFWFFFPLRKKSKVSLNDRTCCFIYRVMVTSQSTERDDDNPIEREREHLLRTFGP